MSDKVFISGQSHDNAVLLLAAAEDLEQDVAVVATVDGGFSVPVEVAEQAGFDSDGRPKRAAAKRAAEPQVVDTEGTQVDLAPANDAAQAEQDKAEAEAAEQEKQAAKKAAPRRRAAKKAAPGSSKE